MRNGASKFRLVGFLSVILVFCTQCKNDPTFYANVLRSDVYVQLYDDESYDFLWVFDNSGSMKPRRDFVRDNMQTFLNILNSRKAIDFQMAVVTTDMFSHNGDLVTGNGGAEVIVSATSSDLVADFAAMVNNVVDSPTSFWEQGLESSYQAVFKHGQKFSRPGVPLVMIYLTDEEDYSCAEDCYGVEPENNTNWQPFEVSRYVDYFSQVTKAQNSEIHIFPIVGTEDSPCTVASTGDRYIALQEALSTTEEEVEDGELPSLGVSGSICNSKLADSYQGIAQIIADRGVIFPLSSEATDQGINVYVNQVLVPASSANYVFDPENNAIVFTGAIPKKGSIIEITYSQLTN